MHFGRSCRLITTFGVRIIENLSLAAVPVAVGSSDFPGIATGGDVFVLAETRRTRKQEREYPIGWENCGFSGRKSV
jgi:hypothetical protein